MNFKEKYIISPRYLTPNTKRRSGKLITPGVKFIVAHDTGNPNSTASGNVKYYENTKDAESASAHIFVDDKEIVECIPALTAPQPEKAWHVLYNVTTDNQLYGYDANDAAIGVEYCYGNKINADEAYRKYVWVLAYICYKFGLDPKTSITGHCFLDPQRKTDPVSGLAYSRRTYDQLLKDVVSEYEECTGAPPKRYVFFPENGAVKATTKLNVRKDAPNTRASVVQVVTASTELKYIGYVTDGEPINGNSKWYKDMNGNYFWSGAVLKN
ncbi:MAG TPA: peptidoglycan recognition family protein [Cytophagaceae bacterium]|nr:peptidoglycan recognition family protein [Cytophagaceae bacterium]